MNKIEVAQVLEEQIAHALQIADEQGLIDVAIKLNEALVLINGFGKEPPFADNGARINQ